MFQIFLGLGFEKGKKKHKSSKTEKIQIHKTNPKIHPKKRENPPTTCTIPQRESAMQTSLQVRQFSPKLAKPVLHPAFSEPLTSNGSKQEHGVRYFSDDNQTQNRENVPNDNGCQTMDTPVKMVHMSQFNCSKRMAMSNIVDSGITDIVHVMNKICLLVIFAVIMSMISCAGNVFIEIRQMKTIEQHDIDIQSLWALLLPLTDIVVTSLMLYLQFKFAKPTYQLICGKMDTLCLKCCLKVVRCFWIHPHNDEHNASYIVPSSSQNAVEV
eukprot:697226_1